MEKENADEINKTIDELLRYGLYYSENFGEFFQRVGITRERREKILTDICYYIDNESQNSGDVFSHIAYKYTDFSELIVALLFLYQRTIIDNINVMVESGLVITKQEKKEQGEGI